MDLASRLRAAIAPTHAAIEALPLSCAMVEGVVNRDDYAALLVQLWFVHQTLETELKRHQALLAIYRPATMDRAAALLRDLGEFGPQDRSPVPIDATLSLVRSIADCSSERPWAMLGHLYVLEGSRMGSMALARPLARAFGVEPVAGVGLDYHRDGIETRVQQWMRFKHDLNALPLSPSQQADLVAAAVETMEGLCGMYSALSECTVLVG